MLKLLKMTEAQRRRTLKDGQEAGEMLLDIEARIGELLPSREEAIKGKPSPLGGEGREEVTPIARKKNQKVELTDLEGLRKRVKRIKKRKKGFYKRFKNQSNKRR